MKNFIFSNNILFEFITYSFQYEHFTLDVIFRGTPGSYEHVVLSITKRDPTTNKSKINALFKDLGKKITSVKIDREKEF